VQEDKLARNDDLIAKVREVLLACARSGKMISFSEIETRIGQRIGA
jgi:hypothetical protein